jgi:hypothetical protein
VRDWRQWWGVMAGALLLVAGGILMGSRAPQAVAYASFLGGTTLVLLTWPLTEPAAVPDVSSWRRLQVAMSLKGPIAEGDRLFLTSRLDRRPPLDDGRALYDGADGHPAGIALDNPLKATLEAWLAADPGRLKALANLEEDLAALGQWTGWYSDARILADAQGLRIRYKARQGQEALPWLLLGAAAKASGKAAQLQLAADGEVAVRWLP